MDKENKTSDARYVKLEKQLKQAREEAEYYQRLAIESGKRTIQEINQLLQLFTEHKKVEDKLKENQEKYRKIVENIYDIVYSSYADGILYFVSPNVLLLTGFKPEEIIGHNILEFIHPDDREHVLSDFEKTMKTGEEFPTIFRLLKKDGSYFYVEEFGKVVSERADIVGLTGVLRDISERKNAEEALRESEERFRSLFESAPEFIHILDKTGKILQINPAATLGSGYSEEEVIGKKLFEFFTPASQKIFAREPAILLDKGVHRVEVEFVCKDGKIIIADCSCMVVHNKGKLVYIVTFLRDITEHKQAEKALQSSQKRYKLATSAAKVGVWDWNVKTGEFYIDPIIKNILGYTDEEIPNDIEVLQNYVHKDDKESVIKAAQACLEGKTPEYVFEHRMIHKDGSIKWIGVHGRVIRDEKGNAVRVVGVDTDITERKKAREKLKHAQKELEIKTKNLEEINTALKVLLKHQGTDKKLMEKSILTSLKTLVLPYLEKIKIGASDERQKTYINIIEPVFPISKSRERITPKYSSNKFKL